jgi:hypothetical protein
MWSMFHSQINAAALKAEAHGHMSWIEGGT